MIKRQLGRVKFSNEVLESPHIKSLLGEMEIISKKPLFGSNGDAADYTTIIASHPEFDELPEFLPLGEYLPEYRFLFNRAEGGKVTRLPVEKVNDQTS